MIDNQSVAAVATPDEILSRWKIAAENVLAVLMVEEGAFSTTRAYDAAIFERGLSPLQVPVGAHRTALQTILDLRRENKPVHPATVAANAVGVKEEWIYGIAATYDTSIDGQVFDANVTTLLDLGKTDQMRQLLAGAQRDLGAGKDRSAILMALMSSLAAADAGADDFQDETAEAGGAAFVNLLETTSVKSYKSGIAPIDNWIGGIETNDVIAIGGAYKSRKSSLARNFVMNVVDQGGSVDVCMLESSAVMVRALFICMLAVRWLKEKGWYEAVDEQGYLLRMISARDLVRARSGYKHWHPTKVEAIEEGIRHFRSWGKRLRIYDKSRKGGALYDINSVKRVLLRSQQRYGTDVAVIDHLLALRGFENEHEIVSNAAPEFEGFARHENMNMILLAQMNEQAIREGSGRKGSGIMGGGALAANSDYVFSVNYRGSLGGDVKDDRLLRVKMEYSRYGESGDSIVSDLDIDTATGWVLGVAHPAVQRTNHAVKQGAYKSDDDD